MGNLFGKKKLVWVPVNEKLEDKLQDPNQWTREEDFTGWLTCNDASKFGKINLSFNGIGDTEIKNIAKGFKKNVFCSCLVLSNNFIHADGCQKLMEEIMTNSESSVESLDLRNNCIGPGGAKAVAQWIKQHKELKEVYLSWNSLGNEGLYHIVQALGSKHREARIDVSYGGYDRVSRVKCFQAIDSAQSEKCTEDGDETDWDEMDEKLKKMGIKTKDFGFPPRGLIGYPEA